MCCNPQRQAPTDAWLWVPSHGGSREDRPDQEGIDREEIDRQEIGREEIDRDIIDRRATLGTFDASVSQSLFRSKF